VEEGAGDGSPSKLKRQPYFFYLFYSDSARGLYFSSELIEHITQRCSSRTTTLKSQAQSLQQELKKVMRRFGR
jgi:hypothetical protein